jgi:putative flippase GtrA
MNFEKIWYETSPYLYLLVGLFVLISIDGPFAKACGLILLLAAALILQMRWMFRAKQNRERAKAITRKTAGVRTR